MGNETAPARDITAELQAAISALVNKIKEANLEFGNPGNVFDSEHKFFAGLSAQESLKPETKKRWTNFHQAQHDRTHGLYQQIVESDRIKSELTGEFRDLLDGQLSLVETHSKTLTDLITAIASRHKAGASFGVKRNYLEGNTLTYQVTLGNHSDSFTEALQKYFNSEPVAGKPNVFSFTLKASDLGEALALAAQWSQNLVLLKRDPIVLKHKKPSEFTPRKIINIQQHQPKPGQQDVEQEHAAEKMRPVIGWVGLVSGPEAPSLEPGGR